MKKTAALSALLMILVGAARPRRRRYPRGDAEIYSDRTGRRAPISRASSPVKGRWPTPRSCKNRAYKIALAAQGPTNSWAALFDQEARYHVDQLGKTKVSELLYASADGSADKQAPQVEDLLSQNPDALILVPMGRAALAASVDRAAAQGVPVVLCASGVDGDSYVTEIGT